MGSFLCIDHSPKIVAAASVFYALRVTGLTKNPRYKASWVQEFPEKEVEGTCGAPASRLDIIARRKFIADLTRRDASDHTRSPTVLCEEKPQRDGVEKRPHEEKSQRDGAEKRPRLTPQPAKQSVQPIMPAPADQPSVHRSSTAPLMPSNSPAPLMPSSSPAPLITSNSPAPLMPSSSPAPLMPSNSPAPLITSNSPAPLIPSTETPLLSTTLSRQTSAGTPPFTIDFGIQDESKDLFSFSPSIGNRLL